MLQAIKDYIGNCLQEAKINGCGDDSAVSIRAEACDPILYRYTDGDSLRQFLFVVGFRESVPCPCLAAEVFYGQLTECLKHGLPDLPWGQTPQRFEIVKTAAVEKQRYGEAQHEMVCRLIYYQEGA